MCHCVVFLNTKLYTLPAYTGCVVMKTRLNRMLQCIERKVQETESIWYGSGLLFFITIYHVQTTVVSTTVFPVFKRKVSSLPCTFVFCLYVLGNPVVANLISHSS